jgi:OFA family oxalate/formate antiporter-like MFS transporter
MRYGHDPYLFITFAALIFMFWGEIFSIFPAICGDTFGSKFASANAGTLYTAKGVAALLVPLASVVAAGGNWNRVFILAAVVTIGAGISAKFILSPMRKRFLAASEATDVKS